jgi:hypothetical protein
MVVRGGFEPPKLARQIYSLIPLATREPHLTLKTLSQYQNLDNFILPLSSGAGTKSRTRDLLITSQLLYQLSYAGSCLASRGADITHAPELLQPFDKVFFHFSPPETFSATIAPKRYWQPLRNSSAATGNNCNDNASAL